MAADSGDDQQRRSGDAHRDRMARRSRSQSATVADIGEIPKPKNAKRRESCRLDLFEFLQTYFPDSTGLKPFSDDHRQIIRRIQDAILGGGGNTLNVVYRGFAKTTISENTAIWATAYGHKSFVPIFGNNKTAARELLDSIKLELEENDLLLADFPEICVAVRALEGKTQRCASQTFEGERTHIRWTGDKIVLPTIPGSAASGSVLMTRGILSARGLKHKTPDGKNLRPDFVIVDDPQTDDSARSPYQVQRRINTLRKSILKLAGHRKSINVVVNATWIEEDDMVGALQDRKRFPAWQVAVVPMMRQFADGHETLWLGKYAALRSDFDPDKEGDQERARDKATAYYRRNRKTMDAGAKVSWEHCYNETEISAIQHAYNSLIDDGEDVFASEYQQQPISIGGATDLKLKPADVLAKCNNRTRGSVPGELPLLTAFIDVQEKLLPWAAVAWSPEFSGHVVDFGTHPDQGRPYWSLRTAKKTLRSQQPGAGIEAAIYAGLRALTDDLLSRRWEVEGVGVIRISRLLIDSGWGPTSDVVYQFCAESSHAAVILPSKGRGIGAKDRPMMEWAKGKNEICGWNWRINRPKTRSIAHVIYDANYWKSFTHARLAVPLGDPGGLSICGTNDRGTQLLADQLTAEYFTRTEGHGRTVDEWAQKPGRPDNHLFDCVSGCAVAASILGARLPSFGTPKSSKRTRKRGNGVSYL